MNERETLTQLRFIETRYPSGFEMLVKIIDMYFVMARGIDAVGEKTYFAIQRTQDEIDAEMEGLEDDEVQ